MNQTSTSALSARASTATWTMLLPVIALGLLVRAIGLNGGLWIDEIYSLIRSFREPLGTIATTYWGDNHHPLYAILAHVSRSLLGESPWVIRLPAMLFGVATIPALYALGLAVGNRREALLASLLLAVSYHHVWFSQNARGYSAIAFFATVALWLLIRMSRAPDAKWWQLYALVAALGAYTHLTMILIVVGHAIGYVVWIGVAAPREQRRSALRTGAMAFSLAAVVTLLLYAPMLSEVREYFATRQSGLRGLSTPSWALGEAVRGLVSGFGAGIVVVGAIIVATGAVVGVAGVVSFVRSNRLLILGLTGATAVTVLGAAVARGTMYPRFFFFAIAPALLIVVRGGFVVVQFLWSRSVGPSGRGGERLATGAVGLVIVASAISLQYNMRYPKQDFGGAMGFVDENRAPSDHVVSTGLEADPYRMLYGRDWANVKTLSQLDSVRSLGGRTWVLWTFPRYLQDLAPEVAALLRDQCPSPRVFKGTVGDGDVLVCNLPPQRPGVSTTGASLLPFAP